MIRSNMKIKDGLGIVDLDDKHADYNSIDIMEGNSVIFTIDYKDGSLRVSGNSTLKLDSNILDSTLVIKPVASNVIFVERQVYKRCK